MGGLVFQVVWARLLTGVFGATTYAIATVLATFMGGLALGSWLGGRWASRLRRPTLVYALLEALVALYGLCLPVVIGWMPEVNALLWQSLEGSFPALSAVRLVCVGALLVPPAAAMGATLPILARWTAEQRGRAGLRVGTLYAINTVGALVGTLLAGFVLLPTIGVLATNSVAAGCDLLAGGLIALAAWRLPALGGNSAAAAGPEVERQSLLDSLVQPLEREPGPRDRWVIAISFLGAGLCGMAYEVLWSRSLAMVVGSSVYAFTLVLAVYLLGHALGAAAGARLAGRLRAPMAALAALHTLTGTLAALAFIIVDRLPALFVEILRTIDPTAPLILAIQAGLMALVILPAATAGGAVFPLVIHLLTRGHKVGDEVGRAYAHNTVGAIVGSLGAGFLILPLLGLGPGMKLVALMQVAFGFWLASRAGALGLARRPAAALLPGLAAIAILLGPPLRPGHLAAGMFRVTQVKETYKDTDYIVPELLYHRDGLNATLTVERRGDHLVLKGNGKPEASNWDDMPSQILVGLAPLLLHEDPEKVVLIGFGSGVTAGSILVDRRVKELTVVELEPAMLEASEHFEGVNNRPLSDPRVRIVESDGRNYLAAVDRQWDVIVSEPSNPWIAGVGSLFTVEHFEAARERLAPGGLYMQWLQLYEMREANVRSVIATFGKAFPGFWVFSSKPAGVDLILIGSRGPLTLDVGKLEARWAQPGIAAEAARAGVRDPLDLASLLVMRPEEARRYGQGAPLNTDDNARLEFLAPFDLVKREGSEWLTNLHFSGAWGRQPVRSLRGMPDDPAAREAVLARLVHSLARHGRLEDARSMLDDIGPVDAGPAREAAAVVRRFEGGPEDVPPELAVGRSPEFRQFISKISEGWFQEALDAYHEMPRSERLDDRNRVILGYLLLLEARSEEALDVLEDIVERNEERFPQRFPLVHYLLARAMYESGRYRDGYDQMASYDRLLADRAGATIPPDAPETSPCDDCPGDGGGDLGPDGGLQGGRSPPG